MTYIEARTANPNITYNREISRRALSKLKETLSELESLDSDIYFEAIIEKFTFPQAKSESSLRVDTVGQVSESKSSWKRKQKSV